MGRSLIFILIACSGAAWGQASLCNPGSVGQPNPALPNFNPYHPDADFDGDGVPNKSDSDDDGDGIPDCEDTEVFTRPIMNPNWPADRPIPIWDPPCGSPGSPPCPPLSLDDRPLSDPSTVDEDEAWLASFESGSRGWTGGDNNPGYWLPPFNLTGDADGDGVPNWLDSDDDNDGVPDWADPDHPMYDPHHADADMDCDGVPNWQDDDIDGDGIPNDCDPNPEDGCVPDTEPIDSEECGGEPPEPPRPRPPSRPEPPPPHDRPDPNPPADDPDPPSPPDRPDPPPEPKIDPGGGGGDPGDDECCAAICERLDILIELGRQTVDQLYEIHTLAVESNYYDKLLYQRLISDGDSLRNRMDNALWTIADLMQLVLHEAIYTNDLLYYIADTGGMGGPDVPPPSGPSGSFSPIGEARNFYDLVGSPDSYGGGVKAELEEWTGSWYALEQFRALAGIGFEEGKSAPVWEFEIPFPAIGAFSPEPLAVSVDFAFYEPVRVPVFILIYAICLLNGMKMVWEELRRYG